MKVVILVGKNKGRMGTIKGDIESRKRQGVTKAWVDFGNDEHVCLWLSNMREATALEEILP